MNCVFCDLPAEPLECGHVVCARCVELIGADMPCPASQLCDGGGVMSLVFDAERKLFAPREDESQELAWRRTNLTKLLAWRGRLERVFDALIAIRNAQDVIYEAAEVPSPHKKDELEAERLPALEYAERCIKAEESVVDLLELRASFRDAGHELPPLAARRGFHTRRPVLPHNLWATAYVAAFEIDRERGYGDTFKIEGHHYIISGALTSVRIGELVSVSTTAAHWRYYQRSNGLVGIQQRSCEPFYEVAENPQSRLPHVKGWVWMAYTSLTLRHTGRAVVYALYHETSGRRSPEARYLVLL